MPNELVLSSAARLGDPWLAPTDDLARAYHTLSHYDCPTPEQARCRERMLEWIDRRPLDAHRRTTLEGHLTASALVVDAAFERVLLTHHKKLDRWLQLGGHCDGDANLAHVALREAFEESGIAELSVLPTPIDLDIHEIPARPGEPAHLHYDTRFLVLAPAGAIEHVSSESNALRWVQLGDVDALATDDSVRRLVRILRTRPRIPSA